MHNLSIFFAILSAILGLLFNISPDALVILSTPRGDKGQGGELDNIRHVCSVLPQILSSPAFVAWPGSTEFDEDIYHWAKSGSEVATCSVRPGNTQDLGKLLQLLHWTKTPFAVTGGGHSLNPGFSSTPGVHISMSQFDRLKYNPNLQTIEIGAGLTWDNVYDLLVPLGYTVAGGRVRGGVGVAGFILGGGLSWITNERGLTIDTLLACDIVLPNGTVYTASDESHPDLFFGLKGGLNNFGIVTQFTLRVFPQGNIWGGEVIVPETSIQQATTVIAKYAATVSDPKATVNIIFEYAEGQMSTIVILFYNGPQQPQYLFDEMLAIPGAVVHVSSMHFSALLGAGQPRRTPRRIQHVAPIQRWTPSILSAIGNETMFWGSYLEQYHSGHFFDYVVEIFLPDYYSHGKPSAWPADRSVVHFPLNIAFAWFDEKEDAAVHFALQETVAKIKSDAEAEGQVLADASLYPNLPIIGTPIEEMYGKNLEVLRAVRAQYDPHRAMDLTGGWHF